MDRKRNVLSQMNGREESKKRMSTNEERPSKRHKPTPMQNSKPGTILRMTLTNFMCHSHLDVKFDNSINFVIGRNGSGKSAILTALIVGLGAKATVTNRGNSIKGFIKAGEKSASVSIVLNNAGPFAYKHDVYGDSIEIVRSVTASGSSQYKIKSHSGEVMSKNRKEIQNVVCGLNIQVDNPICILNQDTSRNFLSSSDPKMRYDLFVRATRLDILYEEYKQGNRRRQNSLEVYQEKQRLIQQLAKEIEEMHRRLETHHNIDRTRMNLQTLEVEFLWAMVVDAEAEAKKQRAVTDRCLAESTNLEDIHMRGDEIMKEIVDKVQSFNQNIKELKDTLDSQDKSRKECIQQTNVLQQKLMERMRDKMALEREIERKEVDRRGLKNEIENFTSKMSDRQKNKLENLRSIADLEEKLKQMQEMRVTFQNEKFQSDSDVKAKEDDQEAMLKDLETAKSKLNRSKEHLSAMRRETNNPLAPYGRNTIRLRQIIDAHKSDFREMPRGPLGASVSVKDRKWTVAIEGFIGVALLQAVAVDNDDDRRVLIQLMNKYMPEMAKPLIITSKFFHQVHNVEPNMTRAPSEGCVSLYEAISVNDPVVMNTLIDQLAIEGILLIESDDLAIDLMSKGERVPRKCAQGITQKGDSYYPYPNYRTYCTRYRNSRFLQVDREDLIRQLESDIQGHETNRDELDVTFAKAKSELDEKRRYSAELNHKLETCQTGIRRAQRKLSELRESIEETELGNVQEFENELTEVQRTVDAITEKKEKIEEAIAQLQTQLDSSEENRQQWDRAIAAIDERIQPIQDRIREQLNRKLEIQVSKDKSKRRILVAKQKVEEETKVLMELEGNVKERIAEASSLADQRPEEIRAVPVVVEKMKELQSTIRRMETETGNLEELMEMYKSKSNVLNRTKEILDRIHEDLDMLTAAYHHRRRLCKNTREYFETFIGHCFGKFLKWRQFQGNLSINFEEETLDMVVIPQHGSQGKTQTTNLSGGERSFSTVAFLYSLWQCLDFPFYFLDEFDVFMDKMNRARVMEILIHHAKSNSDTQYVFLTPQDVAFLKDNMDVALHRLEDPTRRISSTQ